MGVGGGPQPSIPASQPASCLLLGIPQLGSVPWAQPLPSCPPPDADAGTHSSGIWPKSDAAVPPVSWEVMENPYQMPREGGGWDRESAAEWHFPELAWPFFAQAPKAEASDPDPSQRAPGAAHSLAAWLANHRLGYLPQTGASLLLASCPLASCAPRLLSVLLGCAPEAEVMDNKALPRCLRAGAQPCLSRV